MTNKESCYECIHQTICTTHQGVKSHLGSPLVINEAQWFTDFFGMLKDVCRAFKAHEEESKEALCLCCHVLITKYKGSLVNLTCFNCSTRSGYFEKDLEYKGKGQARFICPCGFQIVSSMNVISQLSKCPGCGKKAATIR
jgi:hypothetical protein